MGKEERSRTEEREEYQQKFCPKCSKFQMGFVS
jgi:hypothetical protein